MANKRQVPSGSLFYTTISIPKEFFSDRELLAQLQKRERNVLQCLAVVGLASWLTSKDMINKYPLGGASSIQSYQKKMTDYHKRVIILKVGQNSYRREDKFFELWLSQQIGKLEKKYDGAGQLFKEVMDATEQLPQRAQLYL